MRRWIIVGDDDYDPGLGYYAVLIFVCICFFYVVIVCCAIYLLYKLIVFLVKRYKKQQEDKIQEQKDFTIDYSIGNREELKRLLQILQDMYKSGAIEYQEYEELKIGPMQVLIQYNYDPQTRKGRKALKVISEAIYHWENTLQHMIEYNNMRISKVISMDEYLQLKTPLMENLYMKKIAPVLNKKEQKLLNGL